MSSYDEDAVLELVDEWAQDILKLQGVHIKKIVPDLPHAELAFEITWTHKNGKTRTDSTTLSKSLQSYVGPTALLQGDTRSKSMIVSIMPMSLQAKKRIQAEISYFHRALKQSEKLSLKFYAAIFCVSLLIFAYYCLELHNHWFGYDEPWETPLEFILFHLPFSSHSHE